MVTKTLFDNGLVAVSEQIPGFYSCAMGIWVKTGSRFENQQQSGLSHFLEHMFFKGTPSRSAAQIAEEMDAIGGMSNAFTEKEHTCFYARVLEKHMPVALDIIGDMYCHSSFDSQELEREKGVVIEEINMSEDSPEDVVFEMFAKKLWPDHPLGCPILGQPEVISTLTRERLLEYHQAWYGPERMMIAAAGSLKHSQLLECLGGLFGNLKEVCTLETPQAKDELAFTAQQLSLVKAPAPELTRGGLPQAGSGTFVKYRDSEQVNFCYGVPSIASDDPRRFALFVLDSVLGGSMSCRLFQEVREKRGLAYAIGTFQNTYRDCGNFGIYAGTSSENLAQVLSLCRQILEDIRLKGITGQEMERAKEHIKGSLALGLESTSARMMRLARSETYHGRFLPVEDFCRHIDEVTSEQIIELARTVLAPEKFLLCVLGPVNEVDGIVAEGLPAET